MSDMVLRAATADGAVRAFVADTRDTVEEARRIHHTSPTASAALGRLLTAAAILGTTLKGEKSLLTLQIKGDGPVGGLLATADSQGSVKGYAYQPDADVPSLRPGKLNVGGLVGQGTLTVMKDIGLKEPYSGQVPLVSGEIAEDLTYYFAQSEQTPSAVGLGVLIDRDTTVRRAGGFLVQLMPGAPEELVAELEVKLAGFPTVTVLLEEGLTPQDILDKLLGDWNPQILGQTPVAYRCNCTRDRVERALISIGRKDLQQLLEEDKGATLHCHFCGKEYAFTENNLRQIISGIST